MRFSLSNPRSFASTLTGALLLGALATSCGSDGDTTAAAQNTASSGETASGPIAPGSVDAGTMGAGTMGAGTMGAGSMQPGADAAAGGAPSFAMQDGWSDAPSKSDMHVEKWVLPGETEGTDANLVVMAWPSGIGPLEANVTRWVEQVGLDLTGADLSEDQRWVEEPGDFYATMVHVEGAIGSTQGMAADTESSSDAAILAAFIEKPGTPNVWTAKILGPAATVRAHRDRFVAFVQGL